MHGLCFESVEPVFLVEFAQMFNRFFQPDFVFLHHPLVFKDLAESFFFDLQCTLLLPIANHEIRDVETLIRKVFKRFINIWYFLLNQFSLEFGQVLIMLIYNNLKFFEL